MEKVNTVINITNKSGGSHVFHSNHEELEQRINQGYRFIAYGDDMVFFAETIAAENFFISSLKK
jgi:hypothetical protein